MNRLYLLRRKMQLTQKELADRCGCSPAYIGFLERTAPSIRVDHRIRQSLEETLGRNMQDLLTPLEA